MPAAARFLSVDSSRPGSGFRVGEASATGSAGEPAGAAYLVVPVSPRRDTCSECAG
jgi:hypothetical protein